MITRRDVLMSLAAAPLLRAQSQQSPPEQSDKTFSTGVKVVNVFATVRDKKGQIAKDLKQDDFAIEEDGRPQVIKYFAKESDLPLTLGLLVDTSGSMRRYIETERDASYKFFDQVLREDKDSAFLIHFDFEVELLQDLTSSRKTLQDALRQLSGSGGGPQLQRRGQQNPYPGSGGGGQGGPGGGGRQRGGTALYDSILLASDELMRKQTGRKAIILLTDGDDNGSKSTLSEAISSAQKADTLCYAIRFADESANQNPLGGFGRGGGMGGHRGGGGGRPPMSQQTHGNGKKVLEQIAHETGGGYYEGGKKQSLDDIYRQIQEELRNQYSLGFTPDKNAGGAFRTLHVTTKNKNLIVQSRNGYYAAP
jgi:VWFA-related protein